jgi:flagellar L-ring protein FlgH
MSIMERLDKLAVCVAVLLVLSACMPKPKVWTARPLDKEVRLFDNGAIYQAGYNERPIFEDRRPRNVGDVLTIVITEATTATGKAATSADNNGNMNINFPKGMLKAIVPTVSADATLTGNSTVKSASKSENSGNSALSGTITATVMEVLSNGNLIVAGEKLIAIKEESEFVRFTGVINPNTITGSNTVQSNQVADVRMEYKGATSIDGSAGYGMFSRIFHSVLPF